MPELFDYEKLCQDETTESLLSHAFQVAEDKFNIARLLDPEGIISPLPPLVANSTPFTINFEILYHVQN